jgi:hypothetical protein
MTKKANLLPLDETTMRDQEGIYPCVLYTRTQEGGKTRNVWGYPLSDLLKEVKYVVPFLGLERTWDYRAALNGPDSVDFAVTQYLRDPQYNDKHFVSIDFSAYDASVKPEYSLRAFALVASHFQPQYHSELYEVWRRFVTIPIFTPDGELSGAHGVPSGSGFTNTIDSLAQYIIAHGAGHTPLQVQGDDGLYYVDDDEDKEHLYEIFNQAGLEVNESKSHYAKDEFIYLQRYYHRSFTSRDQRGSLGGVYSLFRAYNRIKYLERWTDLGEGGNIAGNDFFSLRTLMILENCKHHPGFEKFARWVQSHDKQGLEFSRGSDKAYSRMLESKTRAGSGPLANGKGFASFEVVKLLNIKT